MQHLHAVVSAIAPVFLVAAAGFAVRRAFPLDMRTLSTLNIYVFIPALVFRSISQQALDWPLFSRLAAAVGLMTLVMGMVLSAAARARRLTGPVHSAFLMTLFPNLGNFGMPVCLFAFGETGLAFAVVILVLGSFVQNSVGIYFAQRSRHTMLKALGLVFRFPMVYAFALALFFQRNAWAFPKPIAGAVSITADASIPVQLMILGAKLAETRLELSANVYLAAAARLVLGPLAAFGIALLLGLEGLAAKVFVVQMSGPVAVGMAVYGVQFDVEPGFLASVVTWTFLLSAVTVSLVLLLVLAASP